MLVVQEMLVCKLFLTAAFTLSWFLFTTEKATGLDEQSVEVSDEIG